MRNETAVSEKSDRAAAIIDSLDEPALVLDEAETIIHLNRDAAEILDIDKDRIIGHRFSDDIENHCATCSRVRAAIESAGSFPSGEQQVELSLTAQGRNHEYLLKSAPLRDSGGSALGTLIVLHDVSLRRESSRTHNIAAMTVAQQLNTPLTSLSLATGLLQRGLEEQNELVREITEDVDRLNHASADLLNVIRVQPGSIALRSVAFDLSAVFAAVSRKFEDRIGHRKIEFAIHAERNLTVSGDPLMLSWVIATLVGNALSHTPKTGTVDLIAEKKDALIKITVRDSGPGIPAETREFVFGGSLRTCDGALQCIETGFSLSIARQIAEAHGGRLFAERLPDGGSVTLTLPLSQQEV